MRPIPFFGKGICRQAHTPGVVSIGTTIRRPLIAESVSHSMAKPFDPKAQELVVFALVDPAPKGELEVFVRGKQAQVGWHAGGRGAGRTTAKQVWHIVAALQEKCQFFSQFRRGMHHQGQAFFHGLASYL